MLYAKSNPQESIWEHTSRLLQGLDTLRIGYGAQINVDDSFWELLRLAVHLHDFGKANSLFQNKIRRLLGEPELPCLLPPEDEIPHNYVSIALIPYSQLQLAEEEWKLLVYAVGYHHERNIEADRKQIQQYVQQTIPHELLMELFAQMQWPYEPEKPSNRLLEWLRKRKEASDALKYDSVLFRRYVLLKGLLHRLDHAASAHVEVETGIDEDAGQKSRAFVERRYQLRPAQQFAVASSNRHAIMVASTGSGKTEAALMWAGSDKLFMTLPLRVSLNAMYDRLRNSANVGLHSLGLLHSGSFDYLFDKDALDAEESYRISRQLSHKVTLTTIDQILKFPFLYRGFEKELATMAYSKLVIDEIQAYDPNIAAMLVKALEMVAKMGGKFMVMTATLPQIYLENLS
ncbi:CRISPR-associated helicase Cas3', partial [Paenibacillus cisolokensis]|uniref:CRISPR-associated helicase Cas3' n=1 Tax=Paenibacillus cisolokensis TaxID=1658519 RepID=UPI003D2792CE